jgi:hypothetical protein
MMITNPADKIAAYDRDSPDVRKRWENGRILERDPKFWEVVKLQRQYEYLLAKANEKQQEMTVKLNALIAERYLEGGTHE